MLGLYPCLRALVGSDEIAYFCLLTSAQVKAMIRGRKVERIASRVGVVLVTREAEWYPVSVNRPVWFTGKKRDLEVISSTLSILNLSAARLSEIQIPETWKPSLDCIIEFRSVRGD